MKKELLEQLESLRIDVDVETQYCDPTGELRARYEKANEMLDECIAIIDKSVIDNYNYYEDEKERIYDYCRENDLSLTDEDLADKLWDVDYITGNQTGYDTEENCQIYVGQNLDLAKEALDSFGVRFRDIPEDSPATYIDATIRCYLLAMLIEELQEEATL